MEITAPDFGAAYQERLRLRGRRILAAVPGRDHLTLKLYDILAGKDVWSKDFDPKALVLHTDDADLTGVLEPNGKIIALDANTGTELLSANVIRGRVTLDEMNGVTEPLLLRDADHFYVMLNKPIDATKVARGASPTTSVITSAVLPSTAGSWPCTDTMVKSGSGKK